MKSVLACNEAGQKVGLVELTRVEVADVDGAHIRTLLLTFFFRHFPDLITNGHIYIAQPPLYGIKFGKETHYVYNDEEKEKHLADLAKNTKTTKNNPKETKEKEDVAEKEDDEEIIENSDENQIMKISGVKINIQRYKGLGEMDPDQLWTTTMNPENRMMKKVTAEDIEEANNIFEVLMGDEVEPRKKFIQTHAKQVQNLDI